MTAFDEIRREQLQADYDLKLKQFERVSEAIRLNVDTIEKPKLETQLEKLTAELKKLENALEVIDTGQIVEPSSKVAKDQEAQAVRRAKAEAQAASQQRKTGRLINGLPRRYDDTTPFYGREQERTLIQEHIQRGERLITIYGRAGAGKTALVSKVLSDLEQHPDLVTGIVALIAGEVQRQVSLDRILSDFGRLLPEGALTYQPGDPASEKVMALLRALQDGRYVLLLDNFESLLDENDTLREAELQALFTGVLEQGGLTLLITTRQPLRLGLLRGYEQLLELDKGLSPKDALLMLRGLDKKGRLPAEDTLLQELITRVEGFPRALEAAVSLPPTLTLAQVLQDNALFEGEVTKHIVEKALSALLPLDMRVMEALALFGQDVALAAVDYLLAPYVDWTLVPLQEVLNRLIERRFANYNPATQRYSLHHIDRSYCEGRIPVGTRADTRKAGQSEPPKSKKQAKRRSSYTPPPYSRYALMARAARFFQTQRKPHTQWKTLADLEPQLTEFEYHMRLEDYQSAANLLFSFDYDYLQIWGHAGLMLALNKRLEGNVKGRTQAGLLLHLGVAYQSLGEIRKSVDYNEQALAMAQANHDKNIEGTALNRLGAAYSDFGEVQKAIIYYEQALTMTRLFRDKAGEGGILANLGTAYHDLGQIEQAINYYKQSLTTAHKLGHKDSKAIALTNLGVAYSSLGDLKKAITYYEQALTISRERNYKQHESTNLGNLGGVYEDLGEMQKALTYYEQALTISHEISNKQRIGSDLGNLGRLYFNIGKVSQSMTYLEQALAIAEQTGDKRLEENILNILGRAFAHIGEYERAYTMMQQGLQIAEDIQDPSLKNFIGTSIARTYLIQGNLLSARHAVEVARQYYAPENNHNAAALHGLIWLRSGYATAAQIAFQQAIEFTDALLKHPQTAYDVRYALALAHAGLALITNGPLDNGKADYEAALAQCDARGVVQQNLRLLEELAKTPNGEQLTPLVAMLMERL